MVFSFDGYAHAGADFFVPPLDEQFGAFLVLDFFDAAGAVLELRRAAFRVEDRRGQLVAGSDPPLVGHVCRAGRYAVRRQAAGNRMAPRRDDVDQFPFRNVQVPAVLGVHGDVARLVGQAGQDAAVAGHSAD